MRCFQSQHLELRTSHLCTGHDLHLNRRHPPFPNTASRLQLSAVNRLGSRHFFTPTVGHAAATQPHGGHLLALRKLREGPGTLSRGRCHLRQSLGHPSKLSKLDRESMPLTNVRLIFSMISSVLTRKIGLLSHPPEAPIRRDHSRTNNNCERCNPGMVCGRKLHRC